MNGSTLQKIGHGASIFFTGIIGLAILSVVLSNSSSSATLITDFFTGLTTLVTQVITPVQGGSNVPLGSVTSATSGASTSSTGSADDGLLSSFGGDFGSADDGLLSAFTGGF